MTEEQLNRLSIYALRSMARKVGVESPTTKRKNILVSEILSILNGNKAPFVPKTKQGRPPKNFSLPFENNVSTAFDQSLFSDLLAFNQETAEFVYDEIRTVFGYAIVSNTASSILLVRDGTKYIKFLIPTTIVEEHKLRHGDGILAEVGSDNSIVKKIFEINGNLVKDYNPLNRINFQTIEHESRDIPLVFDNDAFNKLNIKIGESVLLYDSGNGNMNTDVVLNMINSCSLRKIIYINFSFIPKTIAKITTLKNNVDAFFSLVTEDSTMIQNLVCLATERAKRLCENGDDVLVVVDDLRTINSIDLTDNAIGKNMISLTKDGKNAGSVTFVAISSKDSDMFVYEKLADKKFVIKDNQILPL